MMACGGVTVENSCGKAAPGLEKMTGVVANDGFPSRGDYGTEGGEARHPRDACMARTPRETARRSPHGAQAVAARR